MQPVILNQTVYSPIPHIDYPTSFYGLNLACIFHGHSDIGSLDGASTVESMLERMKSVGMTHITITEHGSLNSAAAIHRLAAKAGLKVIHGVEAYLYWPDDKYDPSATYHITIYFQTKEAFEAYCKLTPLIYSPPRMKVTFGDVKGCITWDDFKELAKHGILVGTACTGGWLNKPIIDHNDVEEAKLRLDKMINLLGAENIYDEWIVDDASYDYSAEEGRLPGLYLREQKPWFNHPDTIRESNKIRWEQVTKPRGIKRVASQDSHYSEREDKIIQDNKRYGSDWLMSFYQHIKGAGEFAALAKETQGNTDAEITEMIVNNIEFCDRFNDYKFLSAKERGFLIPTFEGNARQEIARRIVANNKIDLTNIVYAERLNKELDVLSCSDKLDGLSYMLMVSDIANIAKENNILMNLRGSGGGSLTGYGLLVSITDPIKYDLPFERFLTRGRINTLNPPDMDMDVADKDLLTHLMKQKYGDCMFPISIDNLLKPRSAIRDAERYYYGKVSPETEGLLKTMENIPQGVNETDWLFGYTDDTGSHVPGEYERNKALEYYSKAHPKVWNMVVKACGIMRQKGTHACIDGSTPVYSQGKVQLFRDSNSANGKQITVWSSGIKPTIKLHLNNGISLTCTPDHKLILKNGMEIEAKDSLRQEIDWLPFGRFSGNFDPEYDEAFTAGWMLGDGSNDAFYFTQDKDDIPREIVERWLVKRGVKHWRSKDRSDCTYHGQAGFPEWMQMPTRILQRRFHPSFWNMTEQAQKAYVSGVMSANGWCLTTNGKIGFRCVSSELISDLSTYLHSHGISACLLISKPHEITWHNGSYTSRPSFQLEISRKRYTPDAFEFVQPYKQEQIINRMTPDIQKFWTKTSRIKPIYVKSITAGPEIEVFDFNEPLEHTGYIGGIKVHNCAYVISSEPVPNFMPLYRVGGIHGILCTGYSPKDVEYVGGLKVDILGVSKVTTIQKCFELLKEKRGIEFEWGELPHDPKVYEEIMWSGDTDGTFQLQTNGITKLCMDTKPKSIQDISNLIAAFRPSVIDAPAPIPDYNNMLEYYVAVKQGKCEAELIHPDLEEIYGPTAGAPILQEQQLKVFRDFAGYSYEVAEGVRRAISKKDAKALAEHGHVLQQKVIERGWTPQQAKELFEMILASSRYGFNLSHSTSYAIVAYNTAYLKYHYPQEYWCAELTVEAENEEKIRRYSALLGNMIVQPSITRSHYSQWRIDGDKLVAPLIIIKGCGPAFVEPLWKLVNAASIEDLGLEKKDSTPKPKKSKLKNL